MSFTKFKVKSYTNRKLEIKTRKIKSKQVNPQLKKNSYPTFPQAQNVC